MNKSAEKQTTYKLNIIDRVLMFSLTIFTLLIYPLFVLKFMHYTFMPLPIFSTPTLSNTPYTEPAYLWNFLVYISFFIQHIVMITIFFKTSIPKIIPKYPLYERYIFNFVSITFYFFMLDFAKPVYNEQEILFKIPFAISMALNVVGNLLFAVCMYELLGLLFVPYKISDILRSETITFEGYKTVSDAPLF